MNRIPTHLIDKARVFQSNKRKEGYTLTEIGYVFNQEHTTIRNSVQTFEDMLPFYSKLRELKENFNEEEFIKEYEQHDPDFSFRYENAKSNQQRKKLRKQYSRKVERDNVKKSKKRLPKNLALGFAMFIHKKIEVEMSLDEVELGKLFVLHRTSISYHLNKFKSLILRCEKTRKLYEEFDEDEFFEKYSQYDKNIQERYAEFIKKNKERESQYKPRRIQSHLLAEQSR